MSVSLKTNTSEEVDEEALLLNDLNFQQETFARAYLANGQNGTKAAMEAGYSSPEQAAYRMLKTPWIKAFIDYHLAVRRTLIDAELRARHMTPDRIVEELSIMAGFDLSRVIVQTKDGPKVDLTRLDPHSARALQEVSTEHQTGGKTKVKIKAHSKESALRLLMDYYGMLKQSQVNVQVNVGFAEKMAQRRARALEDR